MMVTREATDRPYEIVSDAAGGCATANPRPGRAARLSRADDAPNPPTAWPAASSALAATTAAVLEQSPALAPLVDILRHELLLPISNMVCGTELLLHGTAERAEQRELLELMRAEGKRVLGMLAELRTAARQQRTHLEVRPAAISLRPLLVDAACLLWDETGPRISLDLLDDLPAVLADRVRTRQVIANLLANARKHTPAAGQIWLSARAMPWHVEVTVSDNGAGIAPGALARVFCRYFRAGRAADPAASDSGIPGDGLGLAIVREIVEAQGGAVWVHSAGPGQGTTVRFTIPRVFDGEGWRDSDSAGI